MFGGRDDLLHPCRKRVAVPCLGAHTIVQQSATLTVGRDALRDALGPAYGTWQTPTDARAASQVENPGFSTSDLALQFIPCKAQSIRIGSDYIIHWVLQSVSAAHHVKSDASARRQLVCQSVYYDLQCGVGMYNTSVVTLLLAFAADPLILDSGKGGSSSSGAVLVCRAQRDGGRATQALPGTPGLVHRALFVARRPGSVVGGMQIISLHTRHNSIVAYLTAFSFPHSVSVTHGQGNIELSCAPLNTDQKEPSRLPVHHRLVANRSGQFD